MTGDRQHRRATDNTRSPRHPSPGRITEGSALPILPGLFLRLDSSHPPATSCGAPEHGRPDRPAASRDNGRVMDAGDRPPVAWRSLAIAAGVFAVVLVAFSGRYGYHRDELYFLVIGGHPAWGYADQPPLIPFLAHGDGLHLRRLARHAAVPPALAGAAVTFVTGLIAGSSGGRGISQLLAALCMAVASVNVAAGHLAGTTAFDLLGWTVVTWLLMRAIRDGARSGSGSDSQRASRSR